MGAVDPVADLGVRDLTVDEPGQIGPVTGDGDDRLGVHELAAVARVVGVTPNPDRALRTGRSAGNRGDRDEQRRVVVDGSGRGGAGGDRALGGAAGRPSEGDEADQAAHVEHDARIDGLAGDHFQAEVLGRGAGGGNCHVLDEGPDTGVGAGLFGIGRGQGGRGAEGEGADGLGADANARREIEIVQLVIGHVTGRAPTGCTSLLGMP
jgi:hypothetical protein